MARGATLLLAVGRALGAR